MPAIHEPKLVFTEDTLRDLVTKSLDVSTLIITDDFNYPLLHDLGRCVLVKDQQIEHIEQVINGEKYSKVIAVGGCTALDFGRACAIGKELIVVPTILSNSCLSTNRSVINRDGVYKSEETTAPKETIISVPTIVANHADQIKHWSASGLGDLLSAISASIEFEYYKSGKSLKAVRIEDIASNVPKCMEALNWALTSLQEFDEAALKELARYLHTSSVDVIRNGDTRLNAASEHWLYYKMQEQQKYSKMLATHGRLVSIGNLITTRLLGEAQGDLSLFEKLSEIHKKTGLPLSYVDLAEITVHKEHIIQGLVDLKEKECLYQECFNSGDYSILDRIFAVN